MTPERTQRWRRFATEPLLHFLLLSLLIFALDTGVRAFQSDRPTIVVPLEVQADARKLFQVGSGREPDQAELQQLLDRWVQQEALYREGLTLGLDRGDRVIRDRVAEKALHLAEAGLGLPPEVDQSVRARKLEESVRGLVGRYHVQLETRTP